MRGLTVKILACLLVASMAPWSGDASAAPRIGAKKPRKSRPDADKAYSLNDIMKSPKEYEERDVFFYCRYASSANLFKSVSTRFNATEHVNFAVWPDKAVLWDENDRKNILPTLYISKMQADIMETQRQLEKYELIAVTGRILNVYAGYPWIMVTKIERVQLPVDRLLTPVIEHMQSGHDALRSESGGVAARHFEQALQYGLPPEYRAKAYEQMASAYLLDNQLDKARDFLRLAVEQDRADPILNLALADVALRMEDAGESLAHCEFALERSGRLPQVYGIMGEAKSLMGDYVKSFADLNTAAGSSGITPREKAMVNVRRARIYVRAGRFTDAAVVYVKASEPGEPLAGEAWLHNEVGLFYERLYLENGDARYLDSAYSAYEEGTRLNRLDADILYNMTETEFRRQHLSPSPDFTLVKELIERISQVEPEYTPARILEGRVLFFEGKSDEAEYRYQSVVGQIGNDSMALMALAEAYMDIARYSDAALAVRRARRLQPWNIRVQALGRHLEDMAVAVAKAEDAARRDGGAWPEDTSTGSERWQREEFESWRLEQDRTASPGRIPMESYESESIPSGEYGQAPREEYYYEDNAGMDRQAEPMPAGREDSGPDAPRQANRIAAAQPVRPSRPDARIEGRTVTVRPGESIRVGPDGLIRQEAGAPYPQDIQASAGPAPVPGRPLRPYPVTEVKLPGNNPAGYGRNREAAVPAPVDPLNLGYTPATREAPEGRTNDSSHDEYYGNGPEPRDGEWRREPDYGAEGGGDDSEYLEFGQIAVSTTAYASLPAREYAETADPIPGAVKIPRAFTFEPDDSPVIIANVSSPGVAAGGMPVRNANLFRRAPGVRRPAEIIEGERVESPSGSDTSVMAPPGSGRVHRTEVRLPSSAQGIGMTSDYAQSY